VAVGDDPGSGDAVSILTWKSGAGAAALPSRPTDRTACKRRAGPGVSPAEGRWRNHRDRQGSMLNSAPFAGPAGHNPREKVLKSTTLARRTVAVLALAAFAATAAAQAQKKEDFTPQVGQAGKDVIWVPTPKSSSSACCAWRRPRRTTS